MALGPGGLEPCVEVEAYAERKDQATHDQPAGLKVPPLYPGVLSRLRRRPVMTAVNKKPERIEMGSAPTELQADMISKKVHTWDFLVLGIMIGEVGSGFKYTLANWLQ
ncbi:hypothetical protein NDU88_001437 [Pleurodeles waltl]|uniref:Uncharacterized protein n=1 Tax=Pleurodeles waltl TaxID=8319 RepID=A0AAV7MKI0_PLEWA|nr:hypothetical protein NDU88_001437 [Pleurodeles waltl]